MSCLHDAKNEDLKRKGQPWRNLSGLFIGLIVGILYAVLCMVVEKKTGKPIPCFGAGCLPTCMPDQVEVWPDCHDPTLQEKH